ncbi:hypothetical protein [Priestia aryabhattai]|uniref:hypothetical protein n=1 Tax=Priestia aryabhattai TaxID=412384 RepID=UPI001C0E64D9|nr:hypothetical protein [Priestia aryabhattai]MBU3573568.1 hypothetical protein [Priestia aryabhattai]WDL86537.1 hypothetical protein IUJ58_21725 [Priestia aryabhattai]
MKRLKADIPSLSKNKVNTASAPTIPKRRYRISSINILNEVMYFMMLAIAIEQGMPTIMMKGAVRYTPISKVDR